MPGSTKVVSKTDVDYEAQRLYSGVGLIQKDQMSKHGIANMLKSGTVSTSKNAKKGMTL